MANRKFVEGHGKGKALSATGSSGDALSPTPGTGKFTNQWYWTNATGK